MFARFRERLSASLVSGLFLPNSSRHFLPSLASSVNNSFSEMEGSLMAVECSDSPIVMIWATAPLCPDSHNPQLSAQLRNHFKADCCVLCLNPNGTVFHLDFCGSWGQDTYNLLF